MGTRTTLHAPVDTVVFDYGAVLVDWNPCHLYDKVFDDLAEEDFFLAEVCTTQWNTLLDGGIPFDVGIAAKIQEWPQYEAQIRMWKTRWIEMVNGLVPGMEEVVRDLKAAGIHLYGLTNWSAETFPLVRSRFGIFDLLEGMVVSGEERLLKPSREIYQLLLNRYGIDAGRSVFVDDNPANVRGAREVGMQSVRFTDAATLRRDLSECIPGLPLQD